MKTLITHLAKSALKFNKLTKKTSQKQTSTHVHDLRVLTRKLRADFWLIPKSQRTKNIRKVRRKLKTLTRVLGRQRKYDVALEDARIYKRKTKKIRIQLKGARKQVKKILHPKNRKQYASYIENAIKDMNLMAEKSFIPRIEILRQKLEEARNHVPKTSNARHKLRIQVKRARYLLEALGDEKIPSLKKLQDHLGRWHDLTVLSDLSGHPKNLIHARNKEWQAAKKELPESLVQTEHKLSAIESKLQSTL